MKKILLLTENPVHKTLYAKGLESLYDVHCRAGTKRTPGDFDAIICDIPDQSRSLDLSWLANEKLPVVVLTSKLRFPLPRSPHCHVLTYPARVDDVVRALGDMGVAPEGK